MSTEDEERHSDSISLSNSDEEDKATSLGDECEMLFCDNGWVEIRNPADSDTEWLMANTSAEIRQ